jgi:succinoglycan biosynthesis protein ExoA
LSVSADALPFVAVVMPVRNEARYVERSLSSVLNQDYPADRLEVIVADGMSTDGTRAIVAEWASRDDRVRLIDNPKQIAPAGLNLAMSCARGSVVARVDGHCEIAHDYIRCAVARLLADSADGVGGPIDTVGETPVARTIAAAMSSKFGVGGSAFRTTKDRTVVVDTIAFPVYTREVIERAGAYDEELVRNQDDEYNYRLRKMGARLLLAAEVRSRYYSRSSIASVFRQYFQYGFWKVRVLQKHPRQMSPRQFVPPVFVAALGGATFLVATPLGWLPLATVLPAYGLANIVATQRVASGKHLGGQALLMPIVFAALHIGYGTGFLIGLVRFAARWRTQSM